MEGRVLRTEYGVHMGSGGLGPVLYVVYVVYVI